MHASRPTYLTPRATRLMGEHVSLHPLRRRDLAELLQLPDDPAWNLLLRRPVGGDGTEAWLEDALRGMRRGVERCWLLRDRATGQLLGSTRFLNLDLHNRRVEIGATWLLAEARGTCANAESKLLLLDHAFDALGVRRVHVQADVRNERSRRAIEALGATFEGVLREHITLADGTSRDTAVYSLLAMEWPALRPALTERIAARPPAWRVRPSSLSGAGRAQELVDRRDALVAQIDGEVVHVQLDVLATDVG
jgi:RimJ/RimL family protein N-acetyltransferase